MPASCVTTTTEPGASHGAELHHPGPRPGRRDRLPARHRPRAAQPVGAAHRRHRRHGRHQGAAERETRRVVPPQVRLLATDNTALRLQDGRGRSLSPGRRGTLSRSRSSSRPALTLSPRPAPARPCSLPSAAPMPTARRSCSPGRRCPACVSQSRWPVWLRTTSGVSANMTASPSPAAVSARPVHRPRRATRAARAGRLGRSPGSCASRRAAWADDQWRGRVARSAGRILGQESGMLRLSGRRPRLQRDHRRAGGFALVRLRAAAAGQRVAFAAGRAGDVPIVWPTLSTLCEPRSTHRSFLRARL